MLFQTVGRFADRTAHTTHSTLSDDDGRVTMDVAFPLVADEDTPERVLEGVSPDLADFAADEITRGVSDAASDPGAWVELVPATSPSVKKLVAHVRTRRGRAHARWGGARCPKLTPVLKAHGFSA